MASGAAVEVTGVIGAGVVDISRVVTVACGETELAASLVVGVALPLEAEGADEADTGLVEEPPARRPGPGMIYLVRV